MLLKELLHLRVKSGVVRLVAVEEHLYILSLCHFYCTKKMLLLFLVHRKNSLDQ